MNPQGVARDLVEVQRRIQLLQDLGLDVAGTQPALELISLARPESAAQVEMIEGDDDEDAGRKLALRLRDERII